MPPSYVELVKKHGRDPGMIKRMSNLRMLWDMPARVEMLKQFPDVQQIISLAVPSPEMMGSPDESPAYARVANEGMAAICREFVERKCCSVSTRAITARSFLGEFESFGRAPAAARWTIAAICTRSV